MNQVVEFQTKEPQMYQNLVRVRVDGWVNDTTPLGQFFHLTLTTMFPKQSGFSGLTLTV